MREIKFRAWDKENKWFINGFNMFGFSTGQGAPTKFLQRFNDKWKIEDVIIQQYTGFKDKNGKEIYEGDAVQRFNDNLVRFPDGSKKYSSWMVVFEYGGWKFKDTPCSPTTSYPSFYSNAQYMEVIGNIYENPDLLGATK